jgi:uncharacterized protein (TIGR02246 family)
MMMATRTTAAGPTTPEALMTRFRDNLHAGDLDALVDLYEPEAVFEPEPGVVVHGHDEIRAALAPFLAVSPTMVVEPRQVLVTGDVALVVNDWSLTGTAPDGQPVSRSGQSADVVRRQPDGSWKVLVDRP